ncbi:glutamine amidotransferase [Seminavis robusta]|uniref:Glutamine amidotransferase n=1 Tax=Seminavis robusta TaxID=568900 RepID=A0A9N8H8D2_9STRA|nr:glutamine amidotransferase [Seminavis robusta]|eukprot:Sro88_g046580.1 glutamine amidotransferase (371) ;mRNA; f:73664-74776
MCRWITFLSTEEILLSDLVLKPSNSLVEQAIDASYHPGFAQRFNHQVNADGFGVGWYHKNSTCPAVFKDTEPAWSNVNLREICNATKSACVIAHVRAASPGMGVYAPNVHPFKAGRLLFAHNGAIQGFSQIRRKLLAQVTDEAYLGIMGTTDSECCFGLLLTNLAKDGYSKISPYEQTEPFGHDRLYNAMKRTIRQLEHILIISGIREAIDVPSRMNFTLSDGETVVCSRFVDKYPLVAPPSLYFAYGDALQMQRELCDEENADDGDDEDAPSDDSRHGIEILDDHDAVEKDLSFQQSLPGKLLKDVDPKSCAFIVSSDPLTKTSSEITWHRIAANSILCYTRGSIPRLHKLKVGGAKKPEDYAFFLVDF